MPCAARLGDQIIHSQALPQAKSGWWGGLLKGAIVGAIIVAVTAVAVVATIGTGGIGTPFVVCAAAVIIGSALKYAQVGFHEGAQQAANMPGVRAGPITVGSANVFINGKAAALACISAVACTQHGNGKQVAQGSQTVAINGHRMARVGDGGVCGFVIGEGSPDVFVGAPPASCHGLAVGSEIPKGLVDAVDTAGKWGARLEFVGQIGMGGPSILKALTSWAGRASLAFVLGVGYEGSKQATDYAKRHGMSASDQMMYGDFGGLTAAVAGGGVLGVGARVFGAAPVVEAPVETPVETPVEAVPETTAPRPDLSPEENFPGQQSGNNCAPQSCQQVIRQATGTNHSEAEMEQIAQGTGAYDPASGTHPGGEADILNAGGVPAHTQPGTPENIQAALDNGQGVVSGHRAGDLWEGDPNYTADPDNPIDGGHAVHTTGLVRDADGNVTGYVINDTGTGTAGRVVPANQYEGSLDGGPIAVTNDPIRTPAQFPAEAAPPAGDTNTVPGDTTDRGAAPGGGGGTLSGKPTEINPDDAPENIQALTRENESAQTLAGNGYNVEQNPPTLPNGKNPDYRIDSGSGPEYYDNYAPTTSKIRNIGDTIQGKVASGQTDRVVVNLDDSPVTPEQLQTQLKEWTGPANPGLKEVLTIKNGQVIRVYP